MMLLGGLKIMLCGGSKNMPYLRFTLNLKYTLNLIYKYSEYEKMKIEKKLCERLLNELY
jgi:hypothetical protein